VCHYSSRVPGPPDYAAGAGAFPRTSSGFDATMRPACALRDRCSGHGVQQPSSSRPSTRNTPRAARGRRGSVWRRAVRRGARVLCNKELQPFNCGQVGAGDTARKCAVGRRGRESCASASSSLRWWRLLEAAARPDPSRLVRAWCVEGDRRHEPELSSATSRGSAVLAPFPLSADLGDGSTHRDFETPAGRVDPVDPTSAPFATLGTGRGHDLRYVRGLRR